jgi:hypothetical protein
MRAVSELMSMAVGSRGVARVVPLALETLVVESQGAGVDHARDVEMAARAVLVDRHGAIGCGRGGLRRSSLAGGVRYVGGWDVETWHDADDHEGQGGNGEEDSLAHGGAPWASIPTETCKS